MQASRGSCDNPRTVVEAESPEWSTASLRPFQSPLKTRKILPFLCLMKILNCKWPLQAIFFKRQNFQLQKLVIFHVAYDCSSFEHNIDRIRTGRRYCRHVESKCASFAQIAAHDGLARNKSCVDTKGTILPVRRWSGRIETTSQENDHEWECSHELFARLCPALETFRDTADRCD